MSPSWGQGWGHVIHLGMGMQVTLLGIGMGICDIH